MQNICPHSCAGIIGVEPEEPIVQQRGYSEVFPLRQSEEQAVPKNVYPQATLQQSP